MAKKIRKPIERKNQFIIPIKVDKIDYKDIETLRRFITDRGKIRPRQLTGVTVQQQTQIAKAIKNARELALLPYLSSGRK